MHAMEHAPPNSWRIEGRRAGASIYDLAAQLYPICRSITGDGVRASLEILSRFVPLTVHELATGTQVFDWSIPREWNIRDAYVKDSSGRKVIDFQKSNLHVVNYSIPVCAKLPLGELKKHIHTLPEQPDLIPYRTSYYAASWGFCISHNQMLELADGDYDVVIDASLEDGQLTYGEFLHRGEQEDEVLLSAHICHPSLANDNCSGLALLAYIARHLGSMRTRYSYRFLFAPGTIGSITWLSRNEASLDRIRAGLVISCVGDGGGPTYKKSRRGDALIDRVMMHVLRYMSPGARVVEFSPYGYDERQFCSPGFDLPVGMFQRSQFGTFPEYHTSADNLDFIRPEHLELSCNLLLAAIDIIEKDRVYVNLNPKCEPQLGRRGLYAAVGGLKDAPAQLMAMLWVLNLSDGGHSLLDIAERAGLPFASVHRAADLLATHGLLSEPGQVSSA
jgi:aminopeptidase-like protein